MAERLGVADGLALGVGDGLAEALALSVGDGVTEALALGVGEELAETAADAEAVRGGGLGSVALGVDPEQAASEAEATMVTVTQPATVSPALIQPGQRLCASSPDLLARPPGGGAFPVGIKENPICCTCAQWPIHHLSITLRH